MNNVGSKTLNNAVLTALNRLCVFTRVAVLALSDLKLPAYASSLYADKALLLVFDVVLKVQFSQSPNLFIYFKLSKNKNVIIKAFYYQPFFGESFLI